MANAEAQPSRVKRVLINSLKITAYLLVVGLVALDGHHRPCGARVQVGGAGGVGGHLGFSV